MRKYYYDDSLDNVYETLLSRMGTGSALSDFMSGGEINIIKGPEKIKDAIYDILSTRYGTRFFLPTYGCKIYECLLEQNDFIQRNLAEMYVKDALDEWEPRITVLSVTSESDNTTLSVNVVYKINSLGMTDSYVYTMEKKVPEMP